MNASEVSTASGSTGDTVQPTTASVSSKKTENERTKTLVIAHRGFSGQYPESTIQAFKAAFNSGFDEWLASLDYDYTAKENQERFISEKAEYIHQNLDREKYSHMLDQEMFGHFLEFYNEHL